LRRTDAAAIASKDGTKKGIDAPSLTLIVVICRWCLLASLWAPFSGSNLSVYQF